MEGSVFQFHSPVFFFLLILTPFIFLFDLKKIRLLRFQLSSRHLLKGVKKQSLRKIFEFLPSLLKTVSFVLLIVALARPQYKNEFTEIKSEGIDIVLALDTSLSMQALDMRWKNQQQTRLFVVKRVVEDFVRGRQYDRIGMVVFGHMAYTQCPLTLDYDILAGFLDIIESGIAGNGTAIGNGLATAVKRLLNSEAKSKIVILLTDGRNEAGEVSPTVAAELAKKHGIKVYTIGVGSNRSLVPLIWKDENGRMQKSIERVGAVDSELLKKIADMTGGEFYRAQTTDVLQEVYNKIDELEKTEVEVKRFQQYKELFEPYLIFAMIFYVLHWFLRNTYFFRIP